MSDVRIEFEGWLSSIADFDRQLLGEWDESDGCYKDGYLNDLWYAFVAGYNRGEKG